MNGMKTNLERSELLREFKVPIPWLRISSSIFAFVALLILTFVEIEDPLIKLVVFIIGAIIGGYHFIIEAIEAVIKKRKINIDVLMTLAIIGAGVLGQFDEGMTIVFLYSITETLEAYTMKRTRTAIKSLMKLVPRTATKVVNNEEIEVPVEELKENDVVVLRPGDHCPTDGIVIFGAAFMNEASITGESIPVKKVTGSPVFSGSICQDGLIKIKVTKPASESTVARIITLVEKAQKQKVPVQQLVDRFTRIYNPLIVVSAFFIFLIPSLIIGNAEQWAVLATTFLVAAAPCALAIATPVTIFAGVGSAGKKGILAKGGAYLERLGDIEAIAFDKTGTLTFGQPILTNIVVRSSKFTEDDALQHAASLEYASNHPLAKAVLQAAKEKNCELLEIEDVKTLPGKGVAGKIGNNNWFFGSLDPEELQPEDAELLNSLKEKGKSVALLTRNDAVIAIFAFEDHVRPETKQIISDLQQLGIEIFMLTGDHQNAAHRVASQLGIPKDHVFAELTPEKKAEIIQNLRNEMKLAMVGDGINDAPALALADLGIAMGTVGTDVALETADIAIMSESLAGLRDAITIGKRMKRIVKQNLVVSTAIIAVVLAGVLAGFVNLSLAILAHEGSELLIVANSLRLLTRTK